VIKTLQTIRRAVLVADTLVMAGCGLVMFCIVITILSDIRMSDEWAKIFKKGGRDGD